jgi:hypothetical protein
MGNCIFNKDPKNISENKSDNKLQEGENKIVKKIHICNNDEQDHQQKIDKLLNMISSNIDKLNLMYSLSKNSKELSPVKQLDKEQNIDHYSKSNTIEKKEYLNIYTSYSEILEKYILFMDKFNHTNLIYSNIIIK